MRTAVRRGFGSASIRQQRLASCRHSNRFIHTSIARKLNITGADEPPPQDDTNKILEEELRFNNEQASIPRDLSSLDANAETEDPPHNVGPPPGSCKTKSNVKKGSGGFDPFPPLPDWFLKHNVHTEIPKRHDGWFPALSETQDSTAEEVEVVSSSMAKAGSQQSVGGEAIGSGNEAQSAAKSSKYRIAEEVMQEALVTCAMSLSLKTQAVHKLYPSTKSHVVIHCAAEDAYIFVDKIVIQLADTLHANLIMLGPQDLAELATGYVSEEPHDDDRALWDLGYVTGPVVSRNDEQRSTANEEDTNIEENDDDDDDSELGNATARAFGSTGAAALVMDIGSLFPNATVMRQKMTNRSSSNGRRPDFPDAFFKPSRNDGKEQLRTAQFENKRKDMLQAVLKAVETKLAGAQAAPRRQKPTVDKKRKTIVYLQNLREMRGTGTGDEIIDELEKLVDARRAKGEHIMIIGGSAQPPPAGQSLRQYDGTPSTQDNFQTIFVTPLPAAITPSNGKLSTKDLRVWHKIGNAAEESDLTRRLMEINYRNIFMMVKWLQPGMAGLSSVEDYTKFFQELNAQAKAEGKGSEYVRKVHDFVWPMDKVHRLVTVAIGQRLMAHPDEGDKQGIETIDIVNALKLLSHSDATKVHWSVMAEANRKVAKSLANVKGASNHAARMKEIKAHASKHEKKLLHGVIDAQEIKVGFEDVHATDDTKEALRTLTTLALTRPDAFQYGVLAKDKLSGILLYGPPGTGKTMLAKAVAKQSGATMLTVSGSDIYNMYVGEGEKNVRAVFSLAKKLAPTVIFIDEGDAILGSRGDGERKSHRELINEFLKEWDGMNETTAFIMVATNRPFDLDDAVLRRLPRKLLVDLPDQKDREAILRLHLKDETLDSEVSIAQLAEKTPLYSGSDLKNVAVSAALAAVREENEEAEKSQGDGVKTYPERRVLKQKHFDKALEEISASVNEDMGSLRAIKQFDERYGDGKGRKKKKGYGFVSGLEAKVETPKVRSP